MHVGLKILLKTNNSTVKVIQRIWISIVFNIFVLVSIFNSVSYMMYLYPCPTDEISYLHLHLIRIWIQMQSNFPASICTLITKGCA